MARTVYLYDPPDRCVVGTVGQPGERVFYLQARSGSRITSVVIEKEQAELLAEKTLELLEEVTRRHPDVLGSPNWLPSKMLTRSIRQSPRTSEQERWALAGMRLLTGSSSRRTFTVPKRSPISKTTPMTLLLNVCGSD